ncbi:MAG: hypothetical protein HZA51_18975, partial [Planctomycetes bacterium]|nr:hypothetical protein [Planctomycetota bacterium]
TEHDVPTQHRPVVVSQGLLVQFPPLTHDPEQFDCVVTEHDVPTQHRPVTGGAVVKLQTCE